MNPYWKKIFLVIILGSFLLPFLTEAITLINPLEASTFEELIESLIDFIFWVGIAVTPLMIIIAGFYFLTAGGDPGRVQTAKKIIFWTIIGFAIVLLAKGIISVLKQILEG